VYSYYAEANSCTTAPRAAINITVNAVPSLSTSTTKTVICKGETSTLSVSGANTYTWSVNQQTTSTIIFSATASGSFSQTVTGQGLNGCKSTTVVVQQVNACLGLEDQMNTNALFSLYPNPGKSEFTLDLDHGAAETHLVVFNLFGAKVFEQKVISDKTYIRPGLAEGFVLLRNNAR
jgi:hypothetical protein